MENKAYAYAGKKPLLTHMYLANWDVGRFGTSRLNCMSFVFVMCACVCVYVLHVLFRRSQTSGEVHQRRRATVTENRVVKKRVQNRTIQGTEPGRQGKKDRMA